MNQIIALAVIQMLVLLTLMLIVPEYVMVTTQQTLAVIALVAVETFVIAGVQTMTH